MSGKNKIKLIAIIAFCAFLTTGCFQNLSSKSRKDEEPVIVILDEDAYSENSSKISTQLKSNKNPTVYTQYNIDLKVNPKEKTFTGIEKIQYTNQTGKPLDLIYLNLYLNAFKDNTFIKQYLSGLENKILPKDFIEGFIDIHSVLVNNEEATFNQSDTLLEVSLKNTVEVKECIEITIQFEGKVPAIAHRIGSNDHALWMGNFLPVVAVHDKDGWNKYPYYPVGDPFFTDIANYTVKVTTPKDYVVIATGNEEEIEKDVEKITKINAQMVRDFALVISNQFESLSLETKDGVSINLYHTKKLFDGEKILRAAERALEYYSKRLGSYPYAELDIVEGELYVPSSMGYSTLILVDSKKLQDASVVLDVAHEIGHQWFYNIIGSNQVKEPWLDEAMVTYLQKNLFLLEEDIEGIMDRQRDRLIKAMAPMREVSLFSDLSTFSSWEAYYNIHYLRGQLMIHALKQKMGSEAFDKFLKAYYEKYAFRIADTQGFIEIAEEIYGSSLSVFFEQWMNAEELPEF
ncbi:MAG: M1 family metallopeptidase [Epulopiscium sp.]|nr:M1 family metallopeptidase [Candidatus Epulonipiscium sp.]